MAILKYKIMVTQSKIKGAAVEEYSTSIYFLSSSYPVSTIFKVSMA